MPAFTNPGYVSPGQTFAVNGGAAAVLDTDTVKINGVNQTVLEWIRRGRIRRSTAAGNVQTFHVLSAPEHEGNKAG